MKINLTFKDGAPLSGHTNIDITEYLDINKFSANLDSLCEASECEVIIAEDIIEYFSSRDVDTVIQHLISKLRKGGSLIIGGIDLGEVCRDFGTKRLNLIEVNILLYGNQVEDWEFRKSAITAFDLCTVLKGYGLKILKCRTNNYKFIIEAERP